LAARPSAFAAEYGPATMIIRRAMLSPPVC
jgi:hypothetical protein